VILVTFCTQHQTDYDKHMALPHTLRMQVHGKNPYACALR